MFAMLFSFFRRKNNQGALPPLLLILTLFALVFNPTSNDYNLQIVICPVIIYCYYLQNQINQITGLWTKCAAISLIVLFVVAYTLVLTPPVYRTLDINRSQLPPLNDSNELVLSTVLFPLFLNAFPALFTMFISCLGLEFLFGKGVTVTRPDLL